MQIKGIKLTTGDELVAQVVGERADGSLEVRDPLMMVMSVVPKTAEDPHGGFACKFYPWTIISEGDIVINATAIAAHYPVPKDVEANYYQNTSGLQIVSGVAAKQILQG